MLPEQALKLTAAPYQILQKRKSCELSYAVAACKSNHGTTVEAVDAPEPLSRRNQFTLAAGSRPKVRANSEVGFSGNTAILQVLDRTAWLANQARRVWTGLPVTSVKLLPIYTARVRRFHTSNAFGMLEKTIHRV